MQTLVIQSGYLGLFTVSFLSATLLPLASEVFVLTMPALGFNVWLVLLFASLGNILGSVINYFVGLKGAAFVLSRYFHTPQNQLNQAKKMIRKWGAPVLFFSWVPVIGDPLTVVAGIFSVRLPRFLFWVSAGKLLRYLFILGILKKLFPGLS